METQPRQACPTDVNDTQWALITPLLPHKQQLSPIISGKATPQIFGITAGVSRVHPLIERKACRSAQDTSTTKTTVKRRAGERRLHTGLAASD